METAIIIFLTFTTISFFIVAVHERNDLRLEKEIKKEMISDFEIRKGILENAHVSEKRQLQIEICELQKENIKLLAILNSKHVQNKGLNVSKDTIDAVFYAMKKSHPDNGGKEEDFIRFKKYYEELTK